MATGIDDIGILLPCASYKNKKCYTQGILYIVIHRNSLLGKLNRIRNCSNLLV